MKCKGIHIPWHYTFMPPLCVNIIFPLSVYLCAAIIAFHCSFFLCVCFLDFFFQDLQQSTWVQIVPIILVSLLIGLLAYTGPNIFAASAQSFRLLTDDALTFGILALFLAGLFFPNIVAKWVITVLSVSLNTFLSISDLVMIWSCNFHCIPTCPDMISFNKKKGRRTLKLYLSAQNSISLTTRTFSHQIAILSSP